MEAFWLLFGVLGWAIAILLAFALMHMAGSQERIARRMEMKINLGSGSSVASHGSRLRSEETGSVSVGGPNPG